MEEDYLIPEPINRIPIKRLYDFKSRKLREVTKLPKEFELSDNEVLFKVKIVAVNYGSDFEMLKMVNNSNLLENYTVVPGNKFMGKIYATNDSNLDFELDNSKYLVFPYTNCIQQLSEIVCKNCYQFLSRDVNEPIDIENFVSNPCLSSFEMGYNLDGGLQDFIKIKNSSEILIKIPDNVSSHDAVLAIDIALPLYSFLKLSDYRYKPKDKILIVISDSKHLNDLLLVFKLLDMDHSNITIFNSLQINNMNETELNTFKNRYNTVLVFCFESKVLLFAFNSIISTGLQSIKSRYRMILFNQHLQFDLEKYDVNCNDKVITQFKLNWYHKFDMMEFLEQLSTLNYQNDTSQPPSVSYNSLESSNVSPIEDKFIKKEDITQLLAIPSKIHWLYYEKDLDLSNEFQKSEKSHSTRQINKYIHTKTYRVCYTNKPNKSKVNAFVFS